MFLSRNKKNNVYPCKLQFYYIKVGFKGVKIIQAGSRDFQPSTVFSCSFVTVCVLLCCFTDEVEEASRTKQTFVMLSCTKIALV